MTLNQRIDGVLDLVSAGADRSGSADFEASSNIYAALALGRLFWPDLETVGGAVFVILHDGDARQVENRISARECSAVRNMDWGAFVESFNRFEVRHLFRAWPGFPEVLSQAEFLLAETLVETWSAKLAASFVDREFSVSIEEPVSEEGPCVLVSQTSPALVAPAGWAG
ncbi:hypothetical protein AB0C89_24645 [Streptomyces sp. NPDC048491]|uniref:hypothetical protein n=1 Tax=Streptomyces sp. NPDC048491 TaxID=3157207 RepID=UPI003440F819